MERVAARIEEQGSASGRNPSCASAPQESAEQGNAYGQSTRFAPQLIREMAQSEALKLRLEVERRFMRTGKLGVPAGPKIIC
jgi:hypothetical protein